MEVLLGLIQLSENAAALQREIAELDQEIAAIFQNQERLRKNLQALGSTQDEKGLRERYVAELAAEEDKLREMRKDLREKKQKKEALEKELRVKIGQLKFESRV